jgi:hypothetical protein
MDTDASRTAPLALLLPSSDPGSEDPGFKGWSACATAMRTYDEELVKGWKEDIDTLLLLVCATIVLERVRTLC